MSARRVKPACGGDAGAPSTKRALRAAVLRDFRAIAFGVRRTMTSGGTYRFSPKACRLFELQMCEAFEVLLDGEIVEQAGRAAARLSRAREYAAFQRALGVCCGAMLSRGKRMGPA